MDQSLGLIGHIIVVAVNLTAQSRSLHHTLLADLVISIVWDVELEEASVRERESSH